MTRYRTLILAMSFIALPLLAQAQGVTVETWSGAAYTAFVADPQQLADNPEILGQPTSISIKTDFFEAPLNTSGVFVRRIMGKLTPPTSGSYEFRCTGNQFMKAWISADAPNFGGRIEVCKLMTQPPPTSRNYNARPEQKSAPVSLIAGRTYYLMAIQVENDNNNISHTSVAWKLPTGYSTPSCTALPTSSCFEQPIPGSRTLPAAYPMMLNFITDRQNITQAGEGATLSYWAKNAKSCTASSSPIDSSWNGPIVPNWTNQNFTVFPPWSIVYQFTCTPLDTNQSPQTISWTISNEYNSSITLAWDIVVRDNLGNPINDIAGYRIYFGYAAGNYLQPVGQGINVPGAQNYFYTLGPGNFTQSAVYYFVVTAYRITSQGVYVESGYSNVVFRMMSAPGIIP